MCVLCGRGCSSLFCDVVVCMCVWKGMVCDVVPLCVCVCGRGCSSLCDVCALIVYLCVVYCFVCSCALIVCVCVCVLCFVM